MTAKPILFIIPGACSLGSQIALEWLEIPYQIGLTTPEIRSSDKFKKINPTGKVGALKDGDITVGENLAILLYLADKYKNKSLVPTVEFYVERVKVYQQLSYLSSGLHPAFGQVMYSERFVTEDVVASFKKLAYQRLLDALTYVDNHLLNNNGFFVGNSLTIVDAQAYGLLRWTLHNNKGDNLVNLAPFKHIELFLNKMQQLKAVKNALAIERNLPQEVTDSQFAGYYAF